MLTLELTAIKGAKQYLEFSDLLGYDSDKIQLVFNRATVQAGIPVDDVQGSLKGDIIAKLPDDPMAVLRAINEGVPFQQSAPNSALAQEIAALADILTRPDGLTKIDEPTPMPAAQPKGLSRWIRPGQKRRPVNGAVHGSRDRVPCSRRSSSRIAAEPDRLVTRQCREVVDHVTPEAPQQ